MYVDKINLPVRRVARVGAPGVKHCYQVFEQSEEGFWEPVSKEYDHSTSAFAALGRLYQKDVIAVVGEDLALV